MKAIDFLKELVDEYPQIVAIAQDESKSVYIYLKEIPVIISYEYSVSWTNKTREYQGDHERIKFSNFIKWNSTDWRKNIVTVNDLKQLENKN